jgi:uncharacterized repeat protein (TIGR03803 family)
MTLRATIFFISVLSLAIWHPHAVAQQLWGTTIQGGPENGGVIFTINTNGEGYVIQKSFSKTTNEGWYPTGSLVYASNNKLYGMTAYGGISNQGVIFEIDPSTKIFAKKLDLNSTTTGGRPLGSLVEANHKLYGLTSRGGDADQGTLFEYDLSTGNLTKKIDFDDDRGISPFGTLVLANNGRLYGVTSMGGEYNEGVLFEYDPANNTFVKKKDLYFGSGGYVSFGGIIQADNGKFYGVTATGGQNDDGVIFEFDLVTESVSAKFHFNEFTSGSITKGNLMQASNGKLYGMTFSGGQAAQGTLFEYDIVSGDFDKKIDFVGAVNGGSPINQLMELPNGKLIGATTNGGQSGSGILFEYDPSIGILVKKYDFKGTMGSQPSGNLILLDENLVTGIDVENTLFEIYPNPVFDRVTIQSRIKNDTFTIRVKDMLGREIVVDHSKTASYLADFTDLQPGLYIIQIESKKSTVNQVKIVKR